MRKRIDSVRLAGVLIALALQSTAGNAAPDLASLAQTSLHGKPAEAAQAAERLRQEGPAGMEAVLALTGESGSPQEIAAVDHICGVRDCPEIRLFWYTDLEQAKAAAKAAGKPILSLRLMGRLDEEFSCANSRFFRTVFYKNREIGDLLRQRFILHWRSVRQVPKVTIDFGNGAHLERTITGNSIHYVLDSRGRLVDALPGLYGPEAFRRSLEEAESAARATARLSNESFLAWISARHKRQIDTLAKALTADLAAPEPAPAIEISPEIARDPWTLVLAKAVADGRLETGSKSAYEGPMRAALNLPSLTDGELQKLAAVRRPSIHLDATSRAFLLRKHGVMEAREAERVVDAFETTMALDEVIDQYRFRPALLKRLSDPAVRRGLDLEAFNLWVYEEVFRAPLSDPWLGLAPDDVYSALPAGTRTTPR